MTRRRVTWCLGCKARGAWASGRCPRCVESPARRAHKRALYSDPLYRDLRSKWADLIALGFEPECPYCHRPILARAAWDLAHPDARLFTTARPAHARCNRSAGAKERAR